MTASITNGLGKPPTRVIFEGEHASFLLRPLEEKDAHIIHAAIIQSLLDLNPFMDWSHQQLNVTSQKERIIKSRKAFFSSVEFDFAVFDKNTNEFLMCASLSKPRSPNKKALGIGFWTTSKHANKGIATVITKVLVVLGFEFLNCDRIEIGSNESNKKSLAVIRKIGFKFEGNSRNYFSDPTDGMLSNGYCNNRTCSLFALTLEDLAELAWYQDIKSKIDVTFLGENGKEIIY